MSAVSASAAVRSRLNYLKHAGSTPYNYTFDPPDGGPWQNCEYDPREMPIANAREFICAPALDACGFELVDAPTRVRDFGDPRQIEQIYYREMQAAALQATGGREAFVFDHMLRRREPDRRPMTFGRHPDHVQGSTPGPAGRVHNDYTEASGKRRLAAVLGDEASRAVRGRYCIVNVWRSTSGPVLDAPLAVCDGRSVAPQDLVPSEIRYPNRTGEVYLMRHNPAHRWAYFHELETTEAIVFKQFDSVPGPTRFTPHSAFEHPDTPPDAPLRESIETRVLVLF
ncbi:CmcJ/NvfI family oxidoreductase [Ramlibacter sp.]|uniref:CmcJ/NvfI family oxidoreductase n=1 Tax=Ramlibacter sp. TaxID=1917967 RepID=UPI0017A7B6DC|nr:CmcJ/NvfI family oxidoreductase [Ramlibacter sp.]MBA2672114.1 methyltransferase [Ramlibacter sp.]